MSLPALPPFAEVFEAIHEHAPYPWQDRLAARVVATGEWPRTIGVPTGTGKTATLDVALYALAAEAERAPGDRRAPRRIVMVVDRRTIVDQSFERARKIRKCLVERRDDPVIGALHDRLLALMSHRPEAMPEEPIQLALLRGGVPRDDGWARRPDQALLAVSTVDQVGSRLLFRGYGVRPRMAPVHAGLLGHDTLLLLDEVHLSRPFQETLEALGGKWRTWREESLPDRWQVVSLSATSADEDAFDLESKDWEVDRLRVRLEASKPVGLAKVAAATHDRSGRPHKMWIKGLRDAVVEQVKGGARCVGVVVNRVDVARTLAAALDGDDRQLLLVTGRMRGPQRAEVSRELERLAGPGWKDKRVDDRPVVCVATQCIEAGADLDFDAMVTEVASLDALVQRFGRVNRTGAHTTAPIVVLGPKDIEKPKQEDPIYGVAPMHTWKWLEEQGEQLDVSPARLEQLTMPELALAPKKRAAVLIPPHLDLLAQTGPVPEPSPEPALYLHGLEPPRPEVQIVWRADVVDDHLSEKQEQADQVTERLLAVPPTSFEALSLPIAAAKRWLAGEEVGSFSDVGGDTDEGWQAGRRRSDIVGFSWDGSEAKPVRAAAIRPGQTLVVPATTGGLGRGNFDPGDDTPVHDFGDLGRTLQTGRPTVRLDPSVHGVLDEDGEPTWPAGLQVPSVPDASVTPRSEAKREVRAWLADLELGTETGTFETLLRHLRGAKRLEITAVGGTWVLRGRRMETDALLALARGESPPPGDDARTADDGSVVSQDPVLLDRHLEGVEAWARHLAASCGVPHDLVEDLARAGRWHDLGKAHPRFQVLLHGGDDIRAASSPPLAKSGQRLRSATARNGAWSRAGLPQGFRHEMASVALLTASAEGRALLDEASDAELVLHLVASHHGHARPFAPAEDHTGCDALPAVELRFDGRELVARGDHGQDALDSGVAARFWRLQRRYGWWGLAWLEAILRLADHRESELEELESDQRTDDEGETR